MHEVLWCRSPDERSNIRHTSHSTPDIAALIRATMFCSPRHAPVAQHEARPARFANAVAEVVGLAAGVGAEAHLIKRRRAAAAHPRAEDRGVAIADHARKARDRAAIH